MLRQSASHWFLFFTFIFFLAGCHTYPYKMRSALDQAGANRKELIKVLNHYRQDPADSLKLQAAKFLIGSMPGHIFKKRPDIFEPAFDSAANYHTWKNRTQAFSKEINNVKQKHPSKFYADSVVKDIQYVSADFLIKNINMAFKAYHEISPYYHYNFDTFCRYVLPYRAYNEPLEFDSRKKEFKKYKWALKQLDSGSSLIQVAHNVIDSAGLRVNPGVSILGALSNSQIERARFGICRDLVNYMVNVFRALGIPAAHDFTPHWGNDYDNGHDWMVILRGENLLALDAGNGHLLNRDYQKSSMAKAYRITYEAYNDFYPFTKDVTLAYKTDNHVEIIHKWGKPDGKQIYLSVFDRRQRWVPVGQAIRAYSDSITFKNIGTHIIYLVGYYNKYRQFKPLNYPFIVKDNDQVKYLNPNKGAITDSAILIRKYPPFYMRNRKTKVRRIKAVNMLKLQGSYDSTFITSHTLLNIKGIQSTHKQTLKFSYKGQYPYYRLKGPDSLRIELAKLDISSSQSYKMVAPFPRRWFHHRFSYLTDENPLTHWGSKNFMTDFIFKSPAKVTSITLQPRNDDNDINIGDSYELFYWNKGWQSLGRRIADDTMLVYHKTPIHALYWLRDLSKGREEHVFTITKNGKQWWPSTSNYREEKGGI